MNPQLSSSDNNQTKNSDFKIKFKKMFLKKSFFVEKVIELKFSYIKYQAWNPPFQIQVVCVVVFLVKSIYQRIDTFTK